GQVEPDPADDVVLRVRPLTPERPEDGEEELGADAVVERTLNLLRRELRARIRVVVAEGEVLVESVQDPRAFDRAARRALSAVEVEHPECSRGAQRAERKGRRDVELRGVLAVAVLDQ